MGTSCLLRWSILLVFSLSAFANGLNGMAMASIAKKISAYFHVSYNAVNQLTVFGMIFPILTYVPAMWICDRNNIELPYYLAMFVVVTSMWVRYLFATADANGFAVILLTQAMVSLVSGPLLNCLPPALSHAFFPKQEQTLATSIGTLSSLLGLGAGLVLAPIFEESIPELLLFHAWAVTIPLGLSMFCLDAAKLCAPVSTEDDERRTSFGELVRSMSALSSPSSMGFSPVRPEEHTMLVGEHEIYDPSAYHRIMHREDSGRGPAFYAIPCRNFKRGTGGKGVHVPFVLSSAYHIVEEREEDVDELGHRFSFSAISSNAQQQTHSRSSARGEMEQGGPQDRASSTLHSDTIRLNNGSEINDHSEEALEVPLLENDRFSEEIALSPYLEALKSVVCCGIFLRLTIAISLLTSVITCLMTLVNEASPPSIDNAAGAQVVSGLFFGFGTIGTTIMSMLADNESRRHIQVARASVLLSILPILITMLGWHLDYAVLIYTGISFLGFFGFGLLPICIELGIKITYDEANEDMSAAVAGLIQASTNVSSVFLILITTPGNIPGLTTPYIPFVWLGVFYFGAILFFTIPVRCS